jgi:hypothetical protein
MLSYIVALIVLAQTPVPLWQTNLVVTETKLRPGQTSPALSCPSVVVVEDGTVLASSTYQNQQVLNTKNECSVVIVGKTHFKQSDFTVHNKFDPALSITGFASAPYSP